MVYNPDGISILAQAQELQECQAELKDADERAELFREKLHEERARMESVLGMLPEWAKTKKPTSPEEFYLAVVQGVRALGTKAADVAELTEALRGERLCHEHGCTRKTAKGLGLLDGFLAHGALWLRKQVAERSRAALRKAGCDGVTPA